MDRDGRERQRVARGSRAGVCWPGTSAIGTEARRVARQEWHVAASSGRGRRGISREGEAGEARRVIAQRCPCGRRGTRDGKAGLDRAGSGSQVLAVKVKAGTERK